MNTAPKQASENEYVDTTFWQKQGFNTFVKAKSDWLGIGKVHLSFVQYDKSSNKAVKNVEAAISVGANSGASAYSLIADVLSGDIAKKRAKSRSQAAAAKSKYAAPFFVAWGGSNGKSRQVQILPGSKTAYVLQVVECDGVTAKNGAIEPKKDAPQSYIMVGLTDEDIKAFAMALLVAIQTYKGAGSAPPAANEPTPAQNPVPAAKPPAAPPVPAQAAEPVRDVIISYDATGEMFVVATREAFPAAFKNGLRQLLKLKERFVLTPEECAPLMAAVANGEVNFPVVTAVGKTDNTKTDYITTRVETVSV